MPSNPLRTPSQTALVNLLTVGVSLLPLSACSLFRSHPAPSQAAVSTPAPVVDDADEAAAAPQTVTDALPDQQLPAAPEVAVLPDAGPELKATAPKNYVVKHGDTLWGIANMFLRNPWQWPEIWYVNPEIHNPHRIYPGDMLRLALGSDGRTVLELVRGPAGMAAATHLEPMLRSASLDTPIDTIPYAVISAFISHPAVMTPDQIRAAPYVVALAQNHDIAGTGHEIFVKKLAAEPGERYSVMHIGEELIDPDSGHKLGYVAIYTGTAQVTAGGPIAKAVLTSAARETLQGDLLVAEEHEPTTDFIPRAPAQPVSGHIIDVIDNVLLAGQYEVVALNRGSNDGLTRGSVVTVDQEADKVTDICATIENMSTCSVHHTITLPTDPAGDVLVFRTFPRMSYGVILASTAPVEVGDRVHSP